MAQAKYLIFQNQDMNPSPVSTAEHLRYFANKHLMRAQEEGAVREAVSSLS